MLAAILKTGIGMQYRQNLGTGRVVGVYKALPIGRDGYVVIVKAFIA